MKDTTRNLMWLVAIVLLSTAYCGEVRECVSVPLPVPVRKSASTGSIESGTFARALDLIQEGKFEAADQLVELTRAQDFAQTGTTGALLVKIIDDYVAAIQKPDFCGDNNWEHYIYEAAISVIYDDDFWDWFNKWVK
jgi:hypothetical protein